jgi:hypothetical protein
MHYYSAGDQNAALLLANDSGYLEWYNTGTENGSGDFVSASYGTIKTATFLSTASVKFQATGGGSNYVAFQPPATIASNVTWTLPAADATTAGFALVSNGAGVLSWAAAGGAITVDSTTTSLYPTMSTSTSGNFTAAKTNFNLVFNGSTNLLSVGGAIKATGQSTIGNNGVWVDFSAPNGRIASINSSGSPASNLQLATTTTGGTTTTALLLDYNQNATFTGTITENSSIVYKENVTPIANALDAVMQLVGGTYDRKNNSTKNEAGLIAEEVDKILPNLVKHREDGSAEGIQYTKLTAYLVEAIKSLKAEIDELKGNK